MSALEMAAVFVSIGSNVAREQNIPAAITKLRQRFGNLLLSSIYESAAVGFIGDPFFNLVAQFDTALPLADIANALNEIELELGRTRHEQRFAPRTIDLDLLLYDDLIVDDGPVSLPRREIEHYAFVLGPLAEIAPDSRYPLTGRSYREMWADLAPHADPLRRMEITV